MRIAETLTFSNQYHDVLDVVSGKVMKVVYASRESIHLNCNLLKVDISIA